MRDRLVRRPSPATVIASIALFVSLGGVSYGVATGSIDSRELKNNDVRSTDLRNNDVRGGDIRTGAVSGSDVGDDSVTGSDVVESSLGTVPSARNAGAAVSAGSAGSANVANRAASAAAVDGVTFRPRVTANPGQTLPVATKGPLTLQLRCVDNGGGNVGFFLEMDTSADNAAFDANVSGSDEDDFDAADPPVEVADQSGTAQTFEQAGFSALTPTGQRFEGFGFAAAKFGGANNCIAEVVLFG